MASITPPSQNATAADMPSAAPLSLTPLLESFIPGFSIFSKIFAEYFHIDLTQYLWSLVVVLALAAAVRYTKDELFYYFNQYCVASAEIHFDDELYNYLMLWISKQGIAQSSMHFLAATSVSSSMIWTGDDDSDDPIDKEDDDDNLGVDGDDAAGVNPTGWDQAKPLHWTPAYGTNYFRHAGRWFAITRERDQGQNVSWGSLYAEQIYLSCLGRDPAPLKAILQDAQRAWVARDGSKTVIYRAVRDPGSADSMEWARCLSRPPRPMSTVVLDQAQKDMILDDMREYLHPYTRRWYANRGIPYRRGYLLHGPPGTGKTSLCFAAAGLLRLRIYVVNLNSKSLSEEGLASLFKNLPWRCICLLEDIDSAGLTGKRGDAPKEEDDEEKKKEDKPPGASPAAETSTSTKGISLSGFLNIIDGVASAEGRILVMTTNHIEKLDPALLRPGRVDRIVHFGYATKDVLVGLFKAIFSQVEAERPEAKGLANGAATKPAVKAIANGAAAEPAAKTNGTAPGPDVKVNGGPLHAHMNGGPPEKTEADGKISAGPASPTSHARPGQVRRYHDKTDDEVDALAETFAAKVPAEEFTPAEIQGYLLQHKYTPEDAVAGVDKWVVARREEKKVQKSGVS